MQITPELRSPAQSTGREGRCPASARQAHSISGGAESLVCSSEQLSRTRVRVTWHVRAVPWPGYLGGNYIPIMTDCSKRNIVTSIVTPLLAQLPGHCGCSPEGVGSIHVNDV